MKDIKITEEEIETYLKEIFEEESKNNYKNLKKVLLKAYWGGITDGLTVSLLTVIAVFVIVQLV